MFALTTTAEGRTWGYTHTTRRGTVASHQDRANWAQFATVAEAEVVRAGFTAAQGTWVVTAL